MVDVRHVTRKHAVERVRRPIAIRRAAHTARAEPLGVARHVLVLLVHVIEHEVLKNPNAVGVRLVDQLPKRRLAANAWIHFPRLDRPVPVVPRHLMYPVARHVRVRRVRLKRRQPDGSHAQRVERPVRDRGFQPLQVPAFPVAPRIRVRRRPRVVRSVTVAVPIRHHHVDDCVLPGERFLLHPEHQPQRQTFATVRRTRREHQPVLAVLQATQRHRHVARRCIHAHTAADYGERGAVVLQFDAIARGVGAGPLDAVRERNHRIVRACTGSGPRDRAR